MKHCPSCSSDKPSVMFYKNRSRHDGLDYHCKHCSMSAVRSYQEKNKDKKLAYAKSYRKTHKYQQINKISRMKHIETVRRLVRERVLSIKAATPKWLTASHFFQMREMVKIRNEVQWLSEARLSIDHIIPLKGPIVCGLHVPWNLQIIPLADNLAKGTKLVPQHNHSETIAPLVTCGPKVLALPGIQKS